MQGRDSRDGRGQKIGRGGGGTALTAWLALSRTITIVSLGCAIAAILRAFLCALRAAGPSVVAFQVLATSFAGVTSDVHNYLLGLMGLSL